MENVRFILLMRHAKHTAGGQVSAAPSKETTYPPPRELTREGWEETETVAEGLKNLPKSGESLLILQLS